MKRAVLDAGQFCFFGQKSFPAGMPDLLMLVFRRCLRGRAALATMSLCRFLIPRASIALLLTLDRRRRASSLHRRERAECGEVHGVADQEDDVLPSHPSSS